MISASLAPWPGRNMSLHDLPVLAISYAERLKSSLASQLDKIGNAQQDLEDEAFLQGIIQSWQNSREDWLPDALVYPVRRDPTKVGRILEKIPEIEGELEAEELSGASFLWEVESHAGFDPPSLSVGILDDRGLAVFRVLTEVPLPHELEIFLIRYDQAQEGHSQESVDYLDLLGRPRLDNFNMAYLDTLSSSHRDCEMVSLLISTYFRPKMLIY